MNVMPYLRQLEAAGFSPEQLDRAVVLAGASRMRYQALCEAVKLQGLTPMEALQALECRPT